MSNTLETRFWTKVDKTDTCWLWKAAKTSKGYGVIGLLRHGRRILDKTHRVSWRIHFGEIPFGLCVLHRCDIPNCVNPNHLFLGTLLDNNLDMKLKGRNSYGETKGTDHWKCKLTERKVKLIRFLRQLGFQRQHVSRLFGISGHQVYQITSRQSWKHV